ncbi:type II toxin-antitoxin system VapC family toxin [Pedobacter xixiisoli]|uniref:PIN domain nuclease, a component of toxin-antitoxin system (PIN domain) n=1 Tax=Pedobacter xixiisoli TaxID=1476464 RepID=A0A286AA15_9SPHI|nr:PIN domain nuclease, a component of toxin-antitoxin system (PIN domain) [Pedobacter xixiisoli]
MRFILDTHIFLFLINGSSSISENTRTIINSRTSKKFISVVSIWKIVIKINIGKLKLKHSISDIYSILKDNDITILQIAEIHLKHYLQLSLIHRDPFDRLIISQAITEDLTLITDDQFIKNYPNLKLI